MTDYKRKPRKPRAKKRSPRKDTAGANKASDARLLMKMRIVSLESRMTVLERLVWPDWEVKEDDARLLEKHPIPEEE